MIANGEGRPKEKLATKVASLHSITKMCAHLREQTSVIDRAADIVLACSAPESFSAAGIVVRRQESV
jgi:hypothetical protein